MNAKKAAEARKKAEAERKRAEAAARKAKSDAEKAEAARKAEEARKAAEEARRREEEAKRREAEAKAAEDAARRKAEAEARAAKEKAREAEKTTEMAAKIERSEAKANRISTGDASDNLSSSFEANKGRLPLPVSGGTIVGHYGKYTVSGASKVTLDNKGIDIQGSPGCQAKAVFNGTVSSVFQYAGSYIVMIRHGKYISVYSGLSSVAVSNGSRVSTGQSIGSVGADENGKHVLQFQLRKESSRLNPEAWVR